MNFLTLSSRLATARRDLASNSDKKPKKSKKICEKKVVSEIGKSEILEFCWLYLSAKCIKKTSWFMLYSGIHYACRRAMLHNFSRHRCDNFLTSRKCCIESVARALPKTRASGVELAQKIASTTPEFVAKFPRMDHAFGARRANFAF